MTGCGESKPNTIPYRFMMSQFQKYTTVIPAKAGIQYFQYFSGHRLSPVRRFFIVLKLALMFRFAKKAFEGLRKKSKGKQFKKILIFGDSNSLCSSNKKPSWPDLLYQKAPFGLQIQNQSCYGRTTQFDDGELNGIEVFQKIVYKKLRFEFAILMLGTNDVKKQYGPPSAEKVAEGMEKIITTAIQNNTAASMILITPPPMNPEKSGDFDPGYRMMEQISYQYRQLAKKYNCILIDLQRLLDTSLHLQTDKIHLNYTGRERVADIVCKELF